MMLGTMYKVKEMEQSMSEIAEIIEKTIPSMKTVLDIITRTKSKVRNHIFLYDFSFNKYIYLNFCF